MVRLAGRRSSQAFMNFLTLMRGRTSTGSGTSSISSWPSWKEESFSLQLYLPLLLVLDPGAWFLDPGTLIMHIINCNLPSPVRRKDNGRKFMADLKVKNTQTCNNATEKSKDLPPTMRKVFFLFKKRTKNKGIFWKVLFENESFFLKWRLAIISMHFIWKLEWVFKFVLWLKRL